MTQQIEIVEGDIQQKLSSTGFIIGAILLGISGLLMPHAAKPTSDLQEMLKPLGEHQFITHLSSLLMALGFWAALIGITGVNRSIITGGTVWARLGFYFTLTGTVLWTVSLSLDMAVASAIANWLAAPIVSKDAAWMVVASLSALGRGMVPMTWIVYWLALTLLNVAMILSGAYPRWLGWAGLIVSISVITLGVIQTFTPRSITLTLIFSLLMLLTTLWDLATGIGIARKVW
ncbi:MAG TPA: hypothetical protein VK249_13785 [Anaerolineales bacterium]|nr:hypothetical protein [Anaerolineales bacterium]